MLINNFLCVLQNTICIRKYVALRVYIVNKLHSEHTAKF